MNTVTVQVSKSYCVHIGSGLLSSLGSHASQMKGIHTVCIVSDSNVFPLYGQSAEESLCSKGFSVIHFVFPAGEESKNGSTYLELLQFLAVNQLTRTDLIVALGGGVVGDMAGFAAATFLRGIRLIQIPTTLLAAVDSSVGGKTAIDLPSGKNLAGAFYQPDLVLCDTDLLNTLPEAVFRDGCAEVIKYAVLYDEELFRYLESRGSSFDREYVITRCVEWKCRAVTDDEFDRGLRMKLNLGHTVGHGVEVNSHFAVSHGSAVSIGISIVSRSAEIHGLCDGISVHRILALLKKFNLPTSTVFSAYALAQAALSDKKRSGSTVSLIVPQAIGNCIILPTPIDKLQAFIQAGL